VTASANRIRCLPLEEWPDADRAAFAAALHRGSLLLDDGPGARLRPNTLRRHRKGYGRFLSWLADAHPENPIGPGSPSGARQATKEVVGLYVAALSASNASGTVLDRLSSLYVVLGWIAPDEDRPWFRPLLKRLAARAEGVRDKRRRLRRAHELLALGMAMMAEVAAPDIRLSRSRPRDRARLYRDGLMIAFLALRPLRLHNLIAMETGRHLVQRNGRWWIEIPGHETKTGTRIDLPFPDQLTEALQGYLQHWRGRLASGARAHQSAALWLTEQGRAMSSTRAHAIICRHTEAAFGLPVNPHLFRDALATTVAVHRPDEVGIVSKMLGHNAIATAGRHYNQARMAEAALHWHQVLHEFGGDGQRLSPKP
jgi:integrase/recombinase XerD